MINYKWMFLIIASVLLFLIYEQYNNSRSNGQHNYGTIEYRLDSIDSVIRLYKTESDVIASRMDKIRFSVWRLNKVYNKTTIRYEKIKQDIISSSDSADWVWFQSEFPEFYNNSKSVEADSSYVEQTGTE